MLFVSRVHLRDRRRERFEPGAHELEARTEVILLRAHLIVNRELPRARRNGLIPYSGRGLVVGGLGALAQSLELRTNEVVVVPLEIASQRIRKQRDLPR